jgi:epoxyqueuosine reductase
MTQPMPRYWTTSLLGEVQAFGAQLGFASVGVSTSDVGQASDGLREWLAAGYHGSMDYMSRHEALRASPAMLHPGTVSCVMVTMNYAPDAPDFEALSARVLAQPDAAYIARYALGQDYHKVMRFNLQLLAKFIESRVGPMGYRVFCDSAPVMEVTLATKAGLGWRGKNTLLLNRQQGSLFFIGTIYTDLAVLQNQDSFVDSPALANGEHCGSCQRCLEVCPTKAFTAPFVLDARKCISYLTIENKGSIPIEYRRAMGNRIYGCDDCQMVCPWNKYAQAASHPDFAVRHGLDNVGLLELFGWSSDDFTQRLSGSAIYRIGYWRWLRNIAVALGNAAAAADVDLKRTVFAALMAKRTCCDVAIPEQALLAEHIEWALLQ